MGYYGIITFTTVGLGDYAPNFKGTGSVGGRMILMLILSLVLIIGLSLFASVIGAVGTLVEYASGDSNKPSSLPSQINGGEAGREDVENPLESHRSSLSSSSNQSAKKLSSAEIKINEDMENDSIELQMTVMTPNTTDQRQKSRRGSRRAKQTKQRNRFKAESECHRLLKQVVIQTNHYRYH